MHLLSCSYAIRKGNIERGEELQRKNPLCNLKKKPTKDPENFFLFGSENIDSGNTQTPKHIFLDFFFPQTDHVIVYS